MKDSTDIGTELEKLGYWSKMYSVNNVFGTGPTKLALMADEIMRKNNVKRVLELGCGQGRDCIFFAEKGYEITATDFSPDAINSVIRNATEKKLSNIRTHLLDLQREFNISEKFDCVYSNLAFQFFNEAELSKIFDRVADLMEENSLLIFSTKKSGDKYHNFGEKINENAFKAKDIIRYFFEKETLQKLVNQFFEIDDFGYESHTNPDNTKSVWWYCVSRKR